MRTITVTTLSVTLVMEKLPGFVQVILDTIEYGAQIKKTPVVVGNCTGFAVNRVFFPYTQAACMLVDLGLDPYMIDMVILKGFGMPMGPFRSAPGHSIGSTWFSPPPLPLTPWLRCIKQCARL